MAPHVALPETDAERARLLGRAVTVTAVLVLLANLSVFQLAQLEQDWWQGIAVLGLSQSQASVFLFAAALVIGLVGSAHEAWSRLALRAANWVVLILSIYATGYIVKVIAVDDAGFSALIVTLLIGLVTSCLLPFASLVILKSHRSQAPVTDPSPEPAA